MRIHLYFFVLAISFFHETGCQMHYARLPGFDYNNFRSTQCWELAKAINENDSSRILHLVQKQKISVNCFDPKFGSSLLDLAIINDKARSFETLIQANVNVNASSPVDGRTALFNLCTYSHSLGHVLFYMKSLVEHGADVNVSVPDTLGGKPIRITALEMLVQNTSDTESIKYLIDHGARLDLYPKDGPGALISKARLNSDLRPLKYLLIDRQISPPEFVAIRNEGTSRREIITLRKSLEERDVSAYPEQQKVKEEILLYLDSKGQ